MANYYEKSKNEDSTDTICCETAGDHWTAKQHKWISEAKDHQLSPKHQQQTRELRSQLTKIDNFRSGPS